MENGDARPSGPREDWLPRTFHALRDRLAGTAFLILGDREAARDAVQEAFVRCWRRRPGEGPVASPEAWIFTVLLNAARDMRRRRKVRRAASLPEEDALPVQAREPDPAAVAERHDDLERVRSALLALPDSEREVFLLRQNGELSFPEIARTLGVPLGTAKSRMRLALSHLRERLSVARIDARRVS